MAAPKKKIAITEDVIISAYTDYSLTHDDLLSFFTQPIKAVVFNFHNLNFKPKFRH